MSGRISFIGAGPGAADLITVRAARRLAAADVVVWSASTLDPACVREHARADVELVDSSQLSHEQAVELFRRAERDRLNVVRLHSGDPVLWGAVQDQYDACARMQLEVEIVPGVTTATAAAAAVGRELTRAEVAQSVLLAGPGTPLREFARDGVTLAVSSPASRVAQLVEELRAGGHADDVPVLVAYKVSRPDEVLLRTTVGELEQAVKAEKLWRTALFLVGTALGASPRRSYGTYRRPDSPVRRRSYRASARRHTPGEDEPDEVPRQRAVVADGPAPVPNIAWWAVREWQEQARSAARGSARRRAEDPAQPGLFGRSTEVRETRAAAGNSAGAGEEDAEAPASDRAESAAQHGNSAAERGSVQRESAGNPAAAGESARAHPSGEQHRAQAEAPQREAAGEPAEDSAGAKPALAVVPDPESTPDSAEPEQAETPAAPAKRARAKTSAASTGTPRATAKATGSRTKAQKSAKGGRSRTTKRKAEE